MIPALIQAQGPPAGIEVQKAVRVDSAFFSLSDFAVYSRHDGFARHFKLVKDFKMDVCYGGKIKSYSLRGNYLSRHAIRDLYNVRAKHITLKFHDIKPLGDSAFATNPYQLAPFEYHLKRKASLAGYVWASICFFHCLSGSTSWCPDSIQAAFAGISTH